MIFDETRLAVLAEARKKIAARPAVPNELFRRARTYGGAYWNADKRFKGEFEAGVHILRDLLATFIFEDAKAMPVETEDQAEQARGVYWLIATHLIAKEIGKNKSDYGYLPFNLTQYL